MAGPHGGIAGTKLVAPRIPQPMVRRRRLNRRLDEHPGRIILVSAPPGFGKTVLVADWLAWAAALPSPPGVRYRWVAPELDGFGEADFSRVAIELGLSTVLTDGRWSALRR